MVLVVNQLVSVLLPIVTQRGQERREEEEVMSFYLRAGGACFLYTHCQALPAQSPFCFRRCAAQCQPARCPPARCCRGTVPGVADATPRVASLVASVASRVCGTWHMAALGASIDRQSHTSTSGGPLLRRPPLLFLEWIMFLATLNW